MAGRGADGGADRSLQREVTTRDIELFTEISGDRNPCTTTPPRRPPRPAA